jgi:predicted phage terminase large subunit-like protein
MYGIPHKWNMQKQILKIYKGYTDFRSSDRPENWEGFAYNIVFLNEAGIILDDAYLYTNAVLPMLMDYPDSKLIAAGTPKLMQGVGRLFKDLADRGKHGESGYHTRTFTTYDNPWLQKRDIDVLAAEIPPNERRQEIHGEFIEPGGADKLFDRAWFEIVDAAPADAVRVRAWDFAATEVKPGTEPDYTVGLRMAKTSQDVYFVEDVVRFRGHPLEVETKLKTIASQDGTTVKIRIPQDPGAAGKIVASTFVRLLSGFQVRTVPETGSKTERARPVAAQAAAGNIKLVRGPWNRAFLDELEAFPHGLHDDQVDATSAAFAALPQHASHPDYSQSGIVNRFR